MNFVIGVISAIFAGAIGFLVERIFSYAKSKKKSQIQIKMNDKEVRVNSFGFDDAMTTITTNLLGEKGYYIYCEDTSSFVDVNFVTIDNKQCILLKKEKTVFGRDKAADIQISDNLISRRHFAIIFENNLCSIMDYGSSNGTFVNGSKIQQQILFDGDKILAGRISMFFCKEH